MASINEHKSASVHGNFCPRRLSWKAPCTCNAEHNPGCAAVAVDFNDLGTCDCGVDAPCDVSKYGGVPPMGAFVSQGVKEAWSTGELPTPSHRDIVTDMIVTDMIVTDEMVDRFLSWRLPDDFMPDCGVSFVKPNHPTSWPVGTNLLTATQARQMLEHVLGMTPVEPDGPRWKSVCDDPGDARDDSPFPYRNGRMVSMDGDSWIDERLLVGEVSPSRREAEVRNRQDEDEILYGNPEAAEPQGVIYARSAADRESVDDQLREDGFYWVLPHQAEEWEPASWGDEGWMLLGMDSASDIPAIVEVGERIIERASLAECVHCCEPCRDLYQVEDSVWCGEAGWSKMDVAHILCLEEKIFRRLNSRDFIDDPINDGWINFFRERAELIALVKATIRYHDDGQLAGRGDSHRIELLRELIEMKND